MPISNLKQRHNFQASVLSPGPGALPFVACLSGLLAGCGVTTARRASDEPRWSHPSITFEVTNQEGADLPVAFLVLPSSQGTIPKRIPVKTGVSNVTMGELVLPPSAVKLTDPFVMVFLPCAPSSDAIFSTGPRYLFEAELRSDKPRGYWTDVYRTQFAYRLSSEHVRVKISNSSRACSAEFYRATSQGELRVPNQSVDFRQIFHDSGLDI